MKRATSLTISLSSILCLVTSMGLSQTPLGTPTTWFVGAGGNGNSYQAFATPGGIARTTAAIYAAARGGFLATISSATENAFVYGIASTYPGIWNSSVPPGTWGPWLGGIQATGSPEPAGGWGWSQGEPFVYSNWSSGEPNNRCPTGGNEQFIHFGNGGGGIAPTWNDFSEAGCFAVLGFIVEYPLEPTFDAQGPICTPVFPVGCGALGDPERISWNGLGLATVDSGSSAGMPCNLTQYGRVVANGPFTSPPGGPMPEPGPGVAAQMYVPLAPGVFKFGFCWDFYNAETAFGPSATFNDGMSIDIVGTACGPSIMNLVYVDTFTPLGPCVDGPPSGCPSFGREVLGAGPQVVTGILVPPGAAFVRVTVWNGGDNGLSSHGVVDALDCTLIVIPSGPGGAVIGNEICPPVAGLTYVTAISLYPGAFPLGWFYGLDMPFFDLLAQVGSGVPPFIGPLDSLGSSAFVVPAGVIPSGFTFWAVTVHLGPPVFFVSSARFPITYTQP